MTSFARLGLLVLLVACAPARGLAARLDEEAQRPPFETMRDLHRLQEQMAHGSLAAQAAQANLMGMIERVFLDADPASWRDPRNARAAILYLFSGGKPTVVRTLLTRSIMPVDLDRLLKGALAYAEGQDQIARDLLDPIDPRSVPAVIGGQLALVEATLVSGSDRKKATHLFDLARLLVPGTLVEEAALRRQIAMQADPAALGPFVALSRQYLHRFHTSIYAQNFKQHVAAMAVRVAAAGDVAQVGKLDPVLAELPAPERRTVYLGMAKAAVVQGRMVAARYAAEHAATLAKDTAPDALRAQLYINAAAIVTEDVAKGVAALEAADQTRLTPDDVDLRDAALAIARSVQAPVLDFTGGLSATASPDTDAALVDQAHKALALGGDLLDQAR